MPKKVIGISKIQNKIKTIRGLQVILDRDIAFLYNVETKVLNQAVKRNHARFPSEFCFQLSETEFKNWKSQIVTSNSDKMGLRRSPYVFTEQGVAMLSALLKSKTAIEVSIQIMNAFVAMRRFINSNLKIFERLDNLEARQVHAELKIDKVLSAIEIKSIQPKQGIFYNGQVFDAWKFVSDLVRSADKSIVLIDNYVDDRILSLFVKRKVGVTVTILSKSISIQMQHEIQKFNEQHPQVNFKEFNLSHDRFLVIDEIDLYHFGASLKDLGKKWFAFSKMDVKAFEMLGKAGLL